MTLQSIIDMIKTDGGSWIIVFLIFSSLIEISPIRINPISSVFKWFSSKLNQEVITRINDIEKKLDTHISESDKRDIRNCRELILNFGNSIISGEKHTQEEYEFIITECDKYEQHCTENNIPNGVATTTIKEIRNRYSQCMHNNSFLK